ncbi:hypothetical protein DBR42_22500 [Pelomonas sp. HMWF004]|nr:hypothetical protein DBR42_22500 [Pelomonas sp. HMWF004]
MPRLVYVLLQVLWGLTATYVFWAGALMFLGLLFAGPLDQVVLALLWPIAVFLSCLHFWAFLIPPLVASFGTVYLLISSARRRGLRYTGWWPWAVNALLALCLFGFTEAYRSAVMYAQAWRIAPDRMHTHTFARSIGIAGEHAPAHAELTKGGVDYIWSYSELAFVPVVQR